MRFFKIICLTLLIFSCSSDDGPSIDLSLLYGQWFSTNTCPSQNNITFNNNGSYIRIGSGNSCEENLNDTYQYTGQFNVSGNNISFNQQTETLIEEGEGNLSVDTFPVELISQKVTILTESELTIERVFDYGDGNRETTNSNYTR
ncbi:hypothetical protein [Winogradskyella sp.]|uniref:hypothetical protein n=1 Tax=Winogradskyella sp. TaxID=1883156 RepID=UPI0026046A12|nr:hypothetical protein [Winogradskyella sp.]